MKLIVGLGNPGRDYENTRHNIGFSFIDSYLSFKGISDKWSSKDNGLFVFLVTNDEKVIFLKPQTYMNLSGDAVRRFMDYYHISVEDLLVISDDLDLNLGCFKLKAHGSCGGHNGLRDIENKIGTSNFKRLKIGISNDKSIDTKDYVLGKISREDQKKLQDLYSVLYQVLDDYFILSFDELMCKYNCKNK